MESIIRKHILRNQIGFLILAGVLLLAFLPVVHAETYQANKNVELKFLCTLNNAIPSSGANYNFTINYPNGSTFIKDNATALGNGLFYYNTNFKESGTNTVQSFCWDGVYSYSNTENIEITYNGKTNPDGIVIVFFSIGFLIVIGFLSYLFIYNLGHFVQMDYDLGDLIKNVSAYFVLLGLYLLSSFYMGNEMIDNFMIWIVGITGFTNVAMSFLAFFVCFLAKRKTQIENAW